MNTGSNKLLDKYGTYPRRPICWEKPLSPRLAPSRSIISRRPMGEDPSVVQDSFNHWQTQSRCAPTGPRISPAAKGVTMQNLGHWDWSGQEGSGKWTHHVEKVKPKAMEDVTSFGGGWDSPEHLKHQLIRQPRRLHPLQCEPIHQSWAPQYLRGLSPVNQAVDCRNYREPWPGTHPPHRGTFHPSEHRQFTQPSSSESGSSKPRPAKPPTYEMYLQMKRKAEQGQKTEASPWLSRPKSERGQQPNYDLSVPNAKAASGTRKNPTRSAVQFYRCQDHLSYRTGGNSERRTQCDIYTEAERSGELRARPNYVTCHTSDKYLCPAGSEHLTGTNLAEYHPSKRGTKGFHQGSDLKHEALKVQSADVEVDGRAGGGERRNRMKGKVLRSKKGEVVFCLISRPDTGPPVMGSGAERAHALPEIASKSSDTRQTLLAKDERKFHEKWGEIQGCKPSNMEVMCGADSAGFSVNQFPSDRSRCRSTYGDIENYWARGRLDCLDSNHSFSPGKKEDLGGRDRRWPCYSGGEDVTGFRNSYHIDRGLDLHKANNSSQVQTVGQRGKREAGCHVWSYHWGRGPVQGEMEETAFVPGDGLSGNSIDKDRKLSDLEWYGRSMFPSSRRRCWDVPLASGGRQLDGNCSREHRNNTQNWHRGRKLPNRKQPIHSSVGTEGRSKSVCANRAPESDRVFIIDATCAIVRAEYISSPKKEQVLYSYPVEVVGSSEASERLREPVQDSVECLTPDKKLWRTAAERYCVERAAECNGINPEKEQSPYPRARVRERPNGRATHILGFPLMNTNSAEVHLQKTGVTETEVNSGAAEEILTSSNCPQTDGTAEKRWGSWMRHTVVSPGKSEEITQGIRQESVESITVHTLQSLYVACDPLSIGDTDSAAGDIQEERARCQEISEESSFVPVEHSPNTKNAEDSKCDEFRRPSEHPYEALSQNLQDMVFESVSRIRRHTAPDSESDDEEVERLLASEVLKPEGDGGGNDRGSQESADSSSSADTVIACGVGQNLAAESAEYLDPTHGVNVPCSPCFPTGNEHCLERSPREDMGGQDEGTTKKWEDDLREVENDA